MGNVASILGTPRGRCSAGSGIRLKAFQVIAAAARMNDSKPKRPKPALDILIVAIGLAFLFLIWASGARAGHPIGAGPAAVVGGFYALYFGALFLLSYFFPDSTYVLSVLRYICEETTRGAKGRRMALVYFALALLIGVSLLLVGFGCW